MVILKLLANSFAQGLTIEYDSLTISGPRVSFPTPSKKRKGECEITPHVGIRLIFKFDKLQQTVGRR
jgi:hypothetical protein